MAWAHLAATKELSDAHREASEKVATAHKEAAKTATNKVASAYGCGSFIRFPWFAIRIVSMPQMPNFKPRISQSTQAQDQTIVRLPTKEG